MVESASINKSLFVLAKCVEAISQNQQRVPYRESKMTRILSLGQNNGMTVMILNLSPSRSYHLDTLSSLNFANRTKKIEVREIENEPIFKGCHRSVPNFTGSSISRQPLRQLTNAVHNTAVNVPKGPSQPGDKPLKAFSVFSDRPRSSENSNPQALAPLKRSPLKRSFGHTSPESFHPSKRRSPPKIARAQPQLSQATLEDIIEKKVSHILAARALDHTAIASQPEISEEVQKRLQLLEQKVEDKGKNDEREQGLTFLLMAKQHAVRGENLSALKMYQLTKDYFPDNAKLDAKIIGLQSKIAAAKKPSRVDAPVVAAKGTQHLDPKSTKDDDEYQDASDANDDGEYDPADSFCFKAKTKKPRSKKPIAALQADNLGAHTPRTKQVLEIINTRDMARLRVMQGIGPKRAEKLLEALCGGDEADEIRHVRSLAELGSLKGVGAKTVENMRMGMGTSAAA